jgi:hypothetical protein
MFPVVPPGRWMTPEGLSAMAPARPGTAGARAPPWPGTTGGTTAEALAVPAGAVPVHCPGRLRGGPAAREVAGSTGPDREPGSGVPYRPSPLVLPLAVPRHPPG